MKIVDPTPNDLDRLLRDYFRSEMPEPWPAPQMPARLAVVPARAGRSRWGLFRSRFALAASVALLLLAQWFLAGRFHSEPGDPGLRDGGASRDTILLPSGDEYQFENRLFQQPGKPTELRMYASPVKEAP
jgi:hypothetical protein